MTTQVHFGGVVVALPDGWVDVTDDLPDGSPPTLAKSDGVGALQFSVAKYQSGVEPRIRKADLLALLEEFGENRGLGQPRKAVRGRGKHEFVGGEFVNEAEVIWAWYITNGQDLVLVTYVSEDRDSPHVAGELQDAGSIVASLEP